MPKLKHQEKIAMALGIEVSDLYIPSAIDLPFTTIIKEITEILLEK